MLARPPFAPDQAGIRFERWLELTRQWESGLHLRSAAGAAGPRRAIACSGASTLAERPAR